MDMPASADESRVPARMIESENEYGGRRFKGIHLDGGRLEAVTFLDCMFERCTFVETIWQSCRFVNSFFLECDLSLMRVPGSVFASTRFEDSKLIGVNWTEAGWPGVGLGDPIALSRCSISHSTFLGLDLQRVRMRECVAVDVDFREADLRKADLRGCELLDSMFQGANLSEADLRGARDYRIDAAETTISGARFTMPEALSLLHSLDIDLSEG